MRPTSDEVWPGRPGEAGMEQTRTSVAAGAGADDTRQLSIPAAATGIGSMPGTSVAEATAVVAGELPEFPHLPELPARGAGADMVARTGVLLARVSTDLSIETVPTGWARRGQGNADMRRAASWLREDLDRAEEVFGSSDGSFKVQVCGPWTWAASVESTSGQPLLRDAGFVADLSEAWAEAAALHVAEVQRRLPRRTVVLQVDEPRLPAVLDGRIATASGFGTIAAVGPGEASLALQRSIDGLGVATVLHCCDSYPFQVAEGAGFSGISWDSAPAADRDDATDPRLAAGTCDRVAAAAESGTRLVVGVVASVGRADADASWRRLQELWRRTGLAEAALADVAVSPACGLAGQSPAGARRALAAATELARRANG